MTPVEFDEQDYIHAKKKKNLPADSNVLQC